MKDKCPICEGLGFKEGKICVCITGKKEPEMPDFLREIFEKFDTTNDRKKGECGGK